MPMECGVLSVLTVRTLRGVRRMLKWLVELSASVEPSTPSCTARESRVACSMCTNVASDTYTVCICMYINMYCTCRKDSQSADSTEYCMTHFPRWKLYQRKLCIDSFVDIGLSSATFDPCGATWRCNSHCIHFLPLIMLPRKSV